MYDIHYQTYIFSADISTHKVGLDVKVIELQAMDGDFIRLSHTTAVAEL